MEHWNPFESNRTTATTINTTVQNIVLNTLVENAARVSTGGSNIMDVSFTARGTGSRVSNVNIEQAFMINVQLFNSASNVTEIQNKIVENLVNAVEKKSGGMDVFASGDDTTIRNNFRSDVQANITMSTVAEFAGKFNNEMKARFLAEEGGVVENVNMRQNMKASVEVINNAVNKMGFVQEIARSVDNKTSRTTENPIVGMITAIGGVVDNLAGFVSSFFSGFNVTMAIYALIIIAIVVAVAYSLPAFLNSEVAKKLVDPKLF